MALTGTLCPGLSGETPQLVVSLFPPKQRRFRESLFRTLRRLPAAVRREKSRGSARFFAETYFPHLFHKPWADFHLRALAAISDPSRHRIVEVFPRFHGKSYLFSILAPLYHCLCRNAHQWVIISRTAPLSQDWLNKIRRELSSNRQLIDDWGIPPVKLWHTNNEDEIELPDYRRITAKGKAYQIRGLHPTGITADDLDDDQSAYSESERDKLEKTFDRGWTNTLPPGRYFYFVGTIISKQCLLAKVERRSRDEDSPWIGELLEATPEKPLWPEEWGQEELQHRLNEIGLKAFSQEFMNRPMSDAGVLFTVVPQYTEPPALTDMNLFMTVDWALTDNERNCPTAIVVAGMDGHRHIYVLDYLQAHLTPDRAVNKVMEMFGKWNDNAKHPVFRIGVESQTIGKVLGMNLKNAMSVEHRHKIFPVNPESKSKYARIQPIQVRCQQGTFFIGPKMAELRHQLLEFGETEYTDLADACGYLEKTCFPPMVKTQAAPQEDPHTIKAYHEQVLEGFKTKGDREDIHPMLGRW